MFVSVNSVLVMKLLTQKVLHSIILIHWTFLENLNDQNQSILLNCYPSESTANCGSLTSPMLSNVWLGFVNY